MVPPLLKDVTDLGSASAPKTLRRLALQSCRGVSTLDEIGLLTGLTYLNIAESGDIASFAPLANLRHLKTLHAYGTTRVVDGDLSALTGLTELTDLRLKGRRDYHPSLNGSWRATPADNGFGDDPSAPRGGRASQRMSGLLSELAGAGYPVASVSELRDSGLRYAALTGS